MGAGINPRAWKLRAIALSAALTAMAGGLYAVVLLIVTPPTVFGMLASAQALIVTLFGGIATICRPGLGALILVPLGETLHAELGNRLPGIQGVVYGAAIIAVVLIAPEGILPRLAKRWRTQPLRGRCARRSRSTPRPTYALPRCRRDRGEAAARGGRTVRSLRRAAGAAERLVRVRAGRDPRHHRSQRRRQDDALQRAERLHRARIGQRAFEGRELLGEPPFEVCRAGVGPHVPGRAAVRAALLAPQRGRRRVRRPRPTTRRRTPARGRRSGASGSPGASAGSRPRSPPSSCA